VGSSTFLFCINTIKTVGTRSSYQDFKEILIRADAVRQFLLQSGITLFKGMKFEELVRLHVDIQFVPAGEKKRNKKSSEEQILVITLATSDGNVNSFDTRKHNEQSVLEHAIQCINRGRSRRH